MSALVACAVVRDDPPRVFVAEDLDTLHWVLACRVVAATPGRDLPAGERDALRQALREERWGDAVFSYIAHGGRGGRLREHRAPRTGRRGGGARRAATDAVVHRIDRSTAGDRRWPRAVVEGCGNA